MSDNENNENNKYWKDELRRLKDELRELKEEVKDRGDKDPFVPPRPRVRHFKHKTGRKRPKDFNFDFDFDFDSSLGGYLESVLGSVAESLDTAFRGVFTTGPKSSSGRKSRFKSPVFTKEQEDSFFEETPELIGLLADSNRLKLLKRLESGPKYQSDLTDDKLQGGKFKHHMDKLQEAGWIIQEKARGRYLITISGREALKFAEFMFTRSNPELFRQKKPETGSDSGDDSPSFVKTREEDVVIETESEGGDDYVLVDDEE
jgi:hypothetical protein